MRGLAVLVLLLVTNQVGAETVNTTAAVANQRRAAEDAALRRQWERIFDAEEAGRKSDTVSISETVSVTRTITPPPTRTPTVSRTKEQTSTDTVTLSSSARRTASATDSVQPPPCKHYLGVSGLNVESVLMQDILDAPESVYGQSFTYYSTSAEVLAQEGFSITVTVSDAIVDFSNVNVRSFIDVTAKDRLFYRAIQGNFLYFGGPASNNDFISQESHGLNRYLTGNPFVLTRTLRSFTVAVDSIPTYRLALDEWIFIAFRGNMTIPSNCGQLTPVALKITAYVPSALTDATQVLCAIGIVAGILAAAAGSSVPSTHHAGMIAIVSSFHFAQEDGAPMPVGLHPLQFGMGSDKYQYTRSAMACYTLIPLVVFLAQRLAVHNMVRRGGVQFADAAHIARYPRLLAGFVMHLAPLLFFACARNFGDLTTTSFIVTSIAIVVYFALLVVANRCILSSTRPFEASFVAGQQPALHPLLRDEDIQPHIQLTTLRSKCFNLRSTVLGYWKSTDAGGTFVPRHGFVFENIRPGIRSWIVFEFLDTFLTAIMCVFDNYTSFLAFYQFFVTLMIKLVALFAIILKQPFVSSHSATLYLSMYAAQVVALVALVVGSLRLPLLTVAYGVKETACLVSIFCVLLDVGVIALRSVIRFRKVYTRSRIVAFYDVTNEEALVLDETLTRGFSQAEVAEQEMLRLEAEKEEAELQQWRDAVRRLGLVDELSLENDAEHLAQLLQRERAATTVADLTLTDEFKKDTVRRREALIPLGDLSHRGAASVDVDLLVATRIKEIRARESAQRSLELEELASLDDGFTDEQRRRNRELDLIDLKTLDETEADAYDSDGMEIDQYHPKWAERMRRRRDNEALKSEIAALSALRQERERTLAAKLQSQAQGTPRVAFAMDREHAQHQQQQHTPTTLRSASPPLSPRRSSPGGGDSPTHRGQRRSHQRPPHESSSDLTTGSSEEAEIEAQRDALRRRAGNSSVPRLNAIRRPRLIELQAIKHYADRKALRASIRALRKARAKQRRLEDYAKYQQPMRADRYAAVMPPSYVGVDADAEDDLSPHLTPAARKAAALIRASNRRIEQERCAQASVARSANPNAERAELEALRDTRSARHQAAAWAQLEVESAGIRAPRPLTEDDFLAI